MDCSSTTTALKYGVGVLGGSIGFGFLAEGPHASAVESILKNAPAIGALVILVIVFLKFGGKALDVFQGTMKEFKDEVKLGLRDNTVSNHVLRDEIRELRRDLLESRKPLPKLPEKFDGTRPE